MVHRVVHKYMQRRGKIYYFRWRVPTDLRSQLGKSELRQSLRTGDYLRAVIRARQYAEAVDDIRMVRQSYFALELTFSEYKAAILDLIGVFRMAKKRIQNNRLGWIQIANITIDYGNDLDKEIEAANRLKAAGLLSADGGVRESAPSGILFSQLYAEFLAHKIDKKEAQKENRQPLSDNIRAEYDRYFSGLIDIMGDPPITTITKKKLKDAVLTYGCLPKRNLKKYKVLSVLELLEMDIPEGDRIANKTTKQVAKLVQGIFSYATEKDLIDSSPARDMKLKLENKTTFAPFSDAEVSTLLSVASDESVLWKKWLIHMAVFTGARRGELVQLRKQDIKFDTDSGRHYILITVKAGNVKSENANRKIPLHQALVRNGFLEFVDSTNNRLFEDLNPQTVTKWFARLRDSVGIELLDDYENRKVFHSFRHTFITKSRGAGNPVEHVQQVVGHEKVGAGVTDTYSHQQPLKVVLGVVDKVAYDKR